MASPISEPSTIQDESAAAQPADPHILAALEVSLKQREQDLAKAYRIARLGTWNWVKATDTVTWSEEVFRAFDLDPNLPPPGYRELQAMHTPESRERLHHAVQRAVLLAEPYEIDVEIVTATGVRKWIIARGEAAAAVNGEVEVLGGTIQDITERKQIEMQLSLREQELSEAQRIAQIGTWRWVRSTDTSTWSPEIFTIFGLDPSSPALGLADLESIYTPNSRERHAQAVERAIACNEPYELDLELLHPDGTTRWITARGIIESVVDGQLESLRGTLQDITERKRAEETVSRSEARYRSVLESITDGLAVLDNNWIYTYFSEQGARILNLRSKEIVGRNFWELFPLAEQNKFGRAYRQAVETGKPVHFDDFYPEPLNKWVECHCYPSAEGLSVYFRDITEQRLAEAAVRERELRFSTLAESLPQLVWAADPSGDRIYVNQRYLDYTGVDSAQLMGSTWKHLLHPDDLPRTLELWQRSMLSGDPYFNEYRIRRHDGMYRSFLVSAVPVRNEVGDIDRWLGSATDIHDRKLAEEALRRNEKLAATGRLAASIAHEINNPLEAVTNSLYLALMDPRLDSETRYYLETAEQELKRVAHVTTQTLRFHRQSVAATQVDLAELMDSAFALFAPRFAAAAITVDRDYVPGMLLFCRGDELRQVFTNFLSNALDATRQGGRIRLRIRTSKDTRQAACPGLRVTIADTGHGIPTQLRKTIFEPFISTKDATGTGLGLWVSDGIVQKHKGHITLRSRTEPPHQGTVFSLFFPCDSNQRDLQP